MKYVVVVGVLDKPESTNVSMALAFIKEGYIVLPVNYRNFLAKHSQESFKEYLEYIVDAYKPELVLFSKCNGVNPSTVKSITSKCKTWLWNMDDKQTILTCKEVMEHAKHSSFSSCTSLMTVDWFKENGVENCHQIFEGVDTSIFKPVPAEEEHKTVVSFIGTKTDERELYKKRLSDEGIAAKFYGFGFEKEVYDKQFSQVCANSDVMLSLNVHNNVPFYFSDRLFRYMACKVPVFHLDSTGTLNKWFKDNEDIVYFSDLNDLIHKLNTTKPDTLSKIATNGYNKVIENHTWAKTVEQILTLTTE